MNVIYISGDDFKDTLFNELTPTQGLLPILYVELRDFLWFDFGDAIKKMLQ